MPPEVGVFGAHLFIAELHYLGINVTIPRLIYHQKKLIAKCNLMGRPVIIVQHILKSMEFKSRPRRNEVADVANTIIDGADVLVLTKQTVTGKYPLESVKTLGNIIKDAETNIWQTMVFSDFCNNRTPPVEGVEAMGIAAVDCAMRTKACAILVITRGGRSASMISKFFPPCSILGICRNATTVKKMLLYKGIEPVLSPAPKTSIFKRDLDDQLQYGIDVGLREGFIQMYSSVVVLVPSEPGFAFANSMFSAQITPKRPRILY